MATALNEVYKMAVGGVNKGGNLLRNSIGFLAPRAIGGAFAGGLAGGLYNAVSDSKVDVGKMAIFGAAGFAGLGLLKRMNAVTSNFANIQKGTGEFVSFAGHTKDTFQAAAKEVQGMKNFQKGKKTYSDFTRSMANSITRQFKKQDFYKDMSKATRGKVYNATLGSMRGIVAGAAIGGTYGMFSDSTSMLGGAAMGAIVGGLAMGIGRYHFNYKYNASRIKDVSKGAANKINTAQSEAPHGLGAFNYKKYQTNMSPAEGAANNAKVSANIKAAEIAKKAKKKNTMTVFTKDGGSYKAPDDRLAGTFDDPFGFKAPTGSGGTNLKPTSITTPGPGILKAGFSLGGVSSRTSNRMSLVTPKTILDDFLNKTNV